MKPQVPQIRIAPKRQLPRNRWLPTLEAEPWRPDEPTGRYPQRWQPLDPRRRNNPTYALPLIGVPTTIHQGGRASDLRERVLSTLEYQGPLFDKENENEALEVLADVDFDYTLLKQSLDKNPHVSIWFERGFDIMPDLDEGKYIWVYTGIKKSSANQLSDVTPVSPTKVVLGPRVETFRVSPYNEWVQRLSEELWRDDLGTGRYPHQWSRLEKDDEMPTFTLPRIGETTTKQLGTGYGLAEKARESLLQSWRVMSIPDRERAMRTLQEIDADYTLLKQSLDKNPEVSTWFQKGYDILPDIEQGRYIWVHTGVRKNSANHLILPKRKYWPTLKAAQPLGQKKSMSSGMSRDPWLEILADETWKIGETRTMTTKRASLFPQEWQELDETSGDYPDFVLPVLGERVAQQQGITHNRLVAKIEAALLPVSWRSMSAPQRERAVETLRDLETDYKLVKEALMKDPRFSLWIERGYDIMPDLEQSKYVWVLTRKSRFDTKSQFWPSLKISPLAQGNGEISEAAAELCEQVPSIVVDVFYDRTPIKTNEAMPLHWDRHVQDGKPYTDLLEEVKEWTGIEKASSISIFTAPTKPARPIEWFARTLYSQRLVGCSDIVAMQGQYVAIGLSSIGYRCSVCLKNALFANTVLMKAFCGEVCHKSFLGQQVK